jgi:hypothetical protein
MLYYAIESPNVEGGSMAKVEIVEASFHRNGIGGVGFYAILFDEAEQGRMIATLFDEPGYCAVYNVKELTANNVEFAGGNSWRGDVFEAALRPALKSYLEREGTNRIGPFSFGPGVADALKSGR